MSGESILITLATTPGGPPSFPVVLKKVMDLPPPNILDGDDGTFGGGEACIWCTTSMLANVALSVRSGSADKFLFFLTHLAEVQLLQWLERIVLVCKYKMATPAGEKRHSRWRFIWFMTDVVTCEFNALLLDMCLRLFPKHIQS